MDKERERVGVEALISKLGGLSIVKDGESPDFVIVNDSTQERVGVEVTHYYPNRTKRGKALVRLHGRDATETKANRNRFFERTDFGYFRFVPRINVDDLLSQCINRKEAKLSAYKTNERDCNQFWLLIMLDFYDNVMCEYVGTIKSAFDKVFVFEEPNNIKELSVLH